MTLNGVMALILRYFTELVYDVVVKKFTFAISSSDDEFLLYQSKRHVSAYYAATVTKFFIKTAKNTQ